MERYLRVAFGVEENVFADGEWVISRDSEDGVYCDPDWFRGHEEEFDFLGMSRAMCPEFSFDYRVSGQWSSKVSRYTYLKIVPCSLRDSNPEENCEQNP